MEGQQCHYKQRRRRRHSATLWVGEGADVYVSEELACRAFRPFVPDDGERARDQSCRSSTIQRAARARARAACWTATDTPVDFEAQCTRDVVMNYVYE